MKRVATARCCAVGGMDSWMVVLGVARSGVVVTQPCVEIVPWRADRADMDTGKARTAGFRERASSNLEPRVKERPGFLTYPNTIAVTGGAPLFYEGQGVGGGVSGMADGDEVVTEVEAKPLG